MLSDVNLHYLTLAVHCPVIGCWPSCSSTFVILRHSSVKLLFNCKIVSTPSSPKKGAQQPSLFGPCLLWPNDHLSQQLLSSCCTVHGRVPILHNGPPIFPSKLPFCMGSLDPHLVRHSLGLSWSTTQVASWSVQPFLHISWQIIVEHLWACPFPQNCPFLSGDLNGSC